MKNRFYFGTAAMVLVLTMAFIGCGDGGGGPPPPGGNGLPDNLNTNNPGDTLVSSHDLPGAQLTEIMNAPGGGFAGWIVNGEGILQLYWTGRNATQCDAVVNAIKSTLSATETKAPLNTVLSGAQGSGTMREATGTYKTVLKYSVIFAVTNLNAWGQNLPQGTLVANFWDESP